ncbi:tetratricopeptide repeat protein 5-like [Anthonomus grandis grandis]|uniref:tetratricopeptide repeat protein 5-like n=1 Tax=Anthonomus grandis grandis TaxID=2921223 RepID=UPI0021652C4D|nr:tetratricopeptide repeat protein 5-like [Anthonomus grandis grandis]
MSLTSTESSCGCGDTHNEIIKYLTEIVDQTYSFRDRYFESHSIEEAINKNKDVESLVNKNIELFNKHEKLALESSKAQYNFLKGKLLNIYPSYNKEAENFLSKAIKLDPKLVEAWNELGECYCKNDDLVKAKSCFEGALKEKKNKISLRNLSILIRQEACNNREASLKTVELGLSYAKEAVQLDPQDGLSWAILGNAHFSYFFSVQQNPNTLKQCLGAYAQAEKDIVAKTTSDLHYNKGITFKYQEEYKLALDSFYEASLYDPTWTLPRIKERQLVKYLQEIKDLVTNKGKLKPKKLQQILQSIDVKHLGPYGGGSYTSSTGATIKLTGITYDSLKPGLNENKVILGKVICSVRNEDNVPFTFCSIDKAGAVIVTTVFNLADGKGVIIGDSVAIPEPYVTDVEFSYKEDIFKFRLVRVETPVIMVVNSKKLGRNLQAGVQMSISSKFD